MTIPVHSFSPQIDSNNSNKYDRTIKQSKLKKAIDENNLDFFLNTAEYKVEKIRNTIIDSRLQSLTNYSKETNNEYSPYLVLLETIDKYTYRIVYNYHNINETITYTPTIKNRRGKSKASLQKYKQEDEDELNEFLFLRIFELIPEFKYACQLQTIINQGSNDISLILEEITARSIIDGQLIRNLLNSYSIFLAYHKAPLESFTKVYADKKKKLKLYKIEDLFEFKLGNLPPGVAFRNGNLEPLQKNSAKKLIPLKFPSFKHCLQYEELTQELPYTHYTQTSLPDLAKKVLQEYLNSQDPKLFAFKRNNQLFNSYKIRGGLRFSNSMGFITDSDYQLVEYDFKNAYPTIARIIDFNSLIKQAYENTLYENLVYLTRSENPGRLKQKVAKYVELAKKVRLKTLTINQMKECLGLIEIKGQLNDTSQNETLEGNFVIAVPEFIRILSTTPNHKKHNYIVRSLVYYNKSLETNSVFLNNDIIDNLHQKKLVQNTLIGQVKHDSPFIYGQITGIMRLLLQSTIYHLEKHNCLILQANTDGLVFAHQDDEILPDFELPIEFILKNQFKSCYNHNKTNMITETYNELFTKIEYHRKAIGKDMANSIIHSIQTDTLNAKQLKRVIQKKFHIHSDYQTYFEIKNHHKVTRVYNKNLLIPYFLLEDEPLLIDGAAHRNYCYVSQFSQTADLTANRTRYLTQNLLLLIKTATSTLIEVRKDIPYLKKINLETSAPDELPIKKFNQHFTIPFRFIKIIEPSPDRMTYCSFLDFDILKSQIFRQEFLELLEKCVLKRELSEKRITLDSYLYIQFLKKLLKRAFILASDASTKSLLGSLPAYTHHIKRQYNNSWIVYQEPFHSKNWNAKLDVHFLVGTNSIHSTDFRFNPTSSRGLNTVLYPTTYKELKDTSIAQDIMTILLEKSKHSLEFYSRQQATTPQEVHQDEQKAYKILNMAIAHQALLNAIKNSSINVLSSIGFATQFYADDDSKESLQILTKQIKHQKDLIVNPCNRKDSIIINNKLSVQEHFHSSGFTQKNYGEYALSCYLKNQPWLDNKDHRIARSRNLNENYMHRDRITQEIIRTEYTRWGEKNIVSFQIKELQEVAKILKRYLPKLKPFAEAFRQMTSFKNKDLELFLEKTLKATIKQILFDAKRERPVKPETNPLNYLYPPPVP